jgi:DNA-binding sugar fermentation-stimulating protein
MGWHLIILCLLAFNLERMVSTRSVGLRSASAMAPNAKKIVAKKKATATTPNKSPATRKKSASQAATPSPKKSHFADNFSMDRKAPLIELPDDVVHGKLVCRPSKRNRSPYVADVLIENENREAIAHVPNLDMGGKCVPGVTLLLKPARDKKGNLVGPDAVSPKFGTPKCEFIAQLLRVDESKLGYTPTFVGAHPTLGEKIAEQLIGRNLLSPMLPKVMSFEREVRNIAGTNMRADFVIHHEDPNLKSRILEVKTVVDTDYATGRVPSGVKCIFYGKDPYVRSGIFPWGNSNQKGPDGEKVVSARAIKHVQELTSIAKGKKHNGEAYDATVLFVVIRGDARRFRPNFEACPSFCKYLKEAEKAGVQIIAKQVIWGEGKDLGKCFEGELLDIDWPEGLSS